MKSQRETTQTSELVSSLLDTATTSTAGRRRTGRPFTVDEESKATPPTFRVHMGRAGQENEKVVRNVAFAMHAILRGAKRQKRGRAARELWWEVRSSKARGMKWTCTSRMAS
jgi:hypothetical protein